MRCGPTAPFTCTRHRETAPRPRLRHRRRWAVGARGCRRRMHLHRQKRYRACHIWHIITRCREHLALLLLIRGFCLSLAGFELVTLMCCSEFEVSSEETGGYAETDLMWSCPLFIDALLCNTIASPMILAESDGDSLPRRPLVRPQPASSQTSTHWYRTSFPFLVPNTHRSRIVPIMANRHHRTPILLFAFLRHYPHYRRSTAQSLLRPIFCWLHPLDGNIVEGQMPIRMCLDGCLFGCESVCEERNLMSNESCIAWARFCVESLTCLQGTQPETTVPGPSLPAPDESNRRKPWFQSPKPLWLDPQSILVFRSPSPAPSSSTPDPRIVSRDHWPQSRKCVRSGRCPCQRGSAAGTAAKAS